MREHEHASLIKELGGGTAVATAIWGGIGPKGKHRETVYKWQVNGIPWRWRPSVETLARERGVRVPPNFFRAPYEVPGAARPVA